MNHVSKIIIIIIIIKKKKKKTKVKKDKGIGSEREGVHQGEIFIFIFSSLRFFLRSKEIGP